MRVKLHQNRDDLQVIVQDQLANVVIRRALEAHANPGHLRVKLEQELTRRLGQRRCRPDLVAESLDQQVQTRLEDVAQRIELHAKLCKPLFPLFVLVRFHLVEVPALCFHRRECAVDARCQFLCAFHG